MPQLLYQNGRFAFKGTYEERTIPEGAGFEWDACEKLWTTRNPLIAERVANKCDESPGLEKLWPYLMRRSRSYATETNFFSKPPEGEKYLDFQKVVGEYVFSIWPALDNLIIGDDPGTGKTIEALLLAKLWGCERILVICPANKREDWAQEIQKWLTKKNKPLIVYGSEDGPALFTAKQSVISWALLKIFSPALYRKPDRPNAWDLVILDEVHYAKNPHAKRTKFALALAKGAKHALCLSGTFPPNNASELWPVLYALFPETIGRMSYLEFVRRYCYMEQFKQHQRYYGVKRAAELGAMLRGTCMIRRDYHRVFPQTPKPLLRIKSVEADERWEDLIEREMNIAEIRGLSAGVHVLAKNAGELANLRRLMSLEKVSLIVDWAKKILETEPKIFIIGYHVEMLEQVATLLSDYGTILISGKTPPKLKHEYKTAFQTSDTLRVCVGQIKACGEAIDLTAARYGIFAEASYVPGDNEQAIGRLRRFGQVKQTVFDFLVVEGTLDARVLKVALEKEGALYDLKDKEGTDEWDIQ